MASFWSANGDNLNQTSESWHMSVFFFPTGKLLDGYSKKHLHALSSFSFPRL